MIYLCLNVLSLASLAKDIADLTVEAGKKEILKKGNFKSIKVNPYGDLILHSPLPYYSTILGKLKVNYGKINFRNIRKVSHSPAKVKNNSTAIFLNSSLQGSLTLKAFSASFLQKSMIETLSIDGGKASFSEGSYVLETVIMDKHSHLTIHNTEPNNLCFFQSIILNNESNLSFIGQGGIWPATLFDSKSQGITVNKLTANLTWVIESSIDTPLPLVPSFSNILIKVSEGLTGYKGTLAYIQSYRRNTSKKTDFSKLYELYKGAAKTGIPIITLKPGSKLPSTFALHALNDYDEDPITRAISYKSSVMDFDTPIEDDQGKWYRFGYRISDDLLSLYLTIEEQKDAFLVIDGKGYILSPSIKAGIILKKVEVRTQGNLKLNDCSVLDSLVIDSGQATLANTSLFFNSSAINKKAELINGARANFSNSSLYCLCQLKDAKAMFSNSNIEGLSLTNSTVILTEKSFSKTLLMDNSQANFFSGSSVWQQPTILTNGSTLTIHSNTRNNLSFFQSITLNDSSRLSFTGVGGCWPNSRANILSEGVIINSPNAGIEWIFQSEANTKSAKVEPVIPCVTDLPVKIGHTNLGYSVVLSYVQQYKDTTKKTDFSKLLNLFKANSAQGITLAELYPNSHLPTNFVLQALTDYSEDPVTHTLSYKVNPKNFNSLIKDDQGKQYQFGCRILVAPLRINLTIEKYQY